MEDYPLVWFMAWEHVDPKPGFRYPKLLDGFIPFLPSTNSGMWMIGPAHFSLQIHIENGLQVSEGIKPFLLQEAKHDMPPAWQILSTQ